MDDLALNQLIDIQAHAVKAALGPEILNGGIPANDRDFYLLGVPRNSRQWEIVGGSPKGMRAKGKFWLAFYHPHRILRAHYAFFVKPDGTIDQGRSPWEFPLAEPIDLTAMVEAGRQAFTGCARVYFTPARGQGGACRSCQRELECLMEGPL